MGEYTSFVVHLWTDPDGGAQRWEVLHVQSQQELAVDDATFVVRVWVGEEGGPFRATVRHAESGEELELQSSDRLLEFVRAYLDAQGLRLAQDAGAEGNHGGTLR